MKIYTLTDPRTHEVRYVGQTINTLHNRLHEHIKDRKGVLGWKANWIKSLHSIGLSPIMEEIDSTSNQEELDQLEIYWIHQMRTWGFRLTNLAEGGRGGSLLPPVRQQISATLTGYKRSPEEIERSAVRRRIEIDQYDMNRNFIRTWDSSATAAKSLGDIEFKKNITACCKGIRNYAYGSRWVYKGELCVIKERAKKVGMLVTLELDGDVLDTYPSVRDAYRQFSTEFANSTFRKRLMKYGQIETSRGIVLVKHRELLGNP